MLKLKDDVDLKELEKYDYEEDDDNYIKTMPDDIHELNVDKKERIIYVYTAISKRYAQEYEVKDLIQAGLVEKIKEEEIKRIKFILDGCDISFIAEAPKDITLEQLLKQCDKIEPDWCACGIKSINKYNEDLIEEYQNPEAEIIIDYNSIKKANEDVSCKLKEEI